MYWTAPVKPVCVCVCLHVNILRLKTNYRLCIHLCTLVCLHILSTYSMCSIVADCAFMHMQSTVYELVCLYESFMCMCVCVCGVFTASLNQRPFTVNPHIVVYTRHWSHSSGFAPRPRPATLLVRLYCHCRVFHAQN